MEEEGGLGDLDADPMPKPIPNPNPKPNPSLEEGALGEQLLGCGEDHLGRVRAGVGG